MISNNLITNVLHNIVIKPHFGGRVRQDLILAGLEARRSVVGLDMLHIPVGGKHRIGLAVVRKSGGSLSPSHKVLKALTFAA